MNREVVVVTGEDVVVSGDLADDAAEALLPAASAAVVWRGVGSVALEGSARALVKRARRTVGTPADRAALRRSLGREPDDRMTQPAHRIVGPLLPRIVRDAADGGVPRSGMSEIAAVERAFYTVAALIASQPRSARAESPDKPAERSDASAGAEIVETRATSAPGNEADAASAAQVVVNESGLAGEAAAAAEGGHSRPGGAGRSLGRCLADAVNQAPVREQADLYGRLEARLRLLCRQDVDGLHRHLPRLVRQLGSDQITVDWVRLLLDLAYWGVDADLVAKTWLQQFYGYARPAGIGQSEVADTGSDQSGASAAEGAANNGENTRP